MASIAELETGETSQQQGEAEPTPADQARSGSAEAEPKPSASSDTRTESSGMEVTYLNLHKVVKGKSVNIMSMILTTYR